MLFCATAAYGSAAACSGGGSEALPVSSLAATPDATVAFAQIQKAWDADDGAAPAVLRSRLESFLKAYPGDGRVALARAYLAFEQMSMDDWAGADRTLATLRDVKPGTTRDVVTVGDARILRHDKQPDAALDRLRPLVGKIVDATIRELFLEEITRSALDAGRDYEAVAYMDAWLRGVGEDKREKAEARVEAELAKLPEQVLEQTYRAMRSNQSATGYGADTQRLIAGRLAATAITRGDPTLARWLLDGDAGPSFVGGDAGVALGEIATSKRGLVSVAGRSIGLLLPTASIDLRDEAADVARGVAWALGLPRMDPAHDDGVRLVTRDDGGDPKRTEAALEELAGEGAAIILAALDNGTADRSLAWGNAHRIAIVSLSTPDHVPVGEWGFVLGQSRDDELRAIADELATRKVARAAIVGADATPILEGRGFPFFLPRVPCDIEEQQAGEPRFPILNWEKQGSHVVVVAGPVECARDVIRELGSANRPAQVALTLDAGSTTARAKNVALMAVSAGAIPVVAVKAEAVSDPDVRAYMAQFGARPSWWNALGRDAGALARVAIAPLPDGTVTDAGAIAQRRTLLQSRIATASSHLWTTDATGFANAHAIKRTLRVVDVPR